MNHYALFAQILDYPGPRLAEIVKEGLTESRCAHPEAARLLGEFQAGCERLGPARIEELYANTFDLQADCSLFAGYHLFGEDWRRSLFLVELKERYQNCGFSCGQEMPDHVVVLLRFLSVQTDPKEETILLEDCLLPVVSKVAACLDPAHNPYRAALDALLLRLGAQGSDGEVRDGGHLQPGEAAR